MYTHGLFKYEDHTYDYISTLQSQKVHWNNTWVLSITGALGIKYSVIYSKCEELNLKSVSVSWRD